jgi:uncharacterized membrane protein YphA (DoxX/SURF4 family)
MESIAPRYQQFQLQGGCRFMVTSSDDSTVPRQFGTDQEKSLRYWMAGFLRIGIGLMMINTGLEEFFIRNGAMGGRNGWGNNASLWALDPILATLPYFEIGLGLALILGFLTTVAAIGSAFLSLTSTLITMFAIVSQMGSALLNQGWRFGQGESFSPSLVNLLPYALMIWLSPLDNNPISIDTLIFGRREFRRTIAPPTPRNGQPDPIQVEPSEDHSSG